jgi:hypothetical protein
VLAVFGRAEARDFADLFAVMDRFGLEHLCDLAMQKDAGFSVPVFRAMCRRFDRLARDEFELDDTTYGHLTRAVDQWQELLLRIELRRECGTGLDRGDDRGPDI